MTTRRNFITAAAAASVAGLPALAIATTAADPFLAALATYEETNKAWKAKLDEFGAACSQATAEAGPRPVLNFGGQTEDGGGEFFVRRFFDQFDPNMPGHADALATALAACHDYSARLAAASERLGIRKLEAEDSVLVALDARNLDAAFSTTPTTPAGFVAYLDLIDREWEYLAGRTSTDDGPIPLKAAYSAIFGSAA